MAIPKAQYEAVAQGMKREMSNRKHTHMMPMVTPYSVQLSICCTHSRLRHGCRVSMNLSPSVSSCAIAAWREGALVAMIL